MAATSEPAGRVDVAAGVSVGTDLSVATASLAAPWGGTDRTADLDGPVHHVDFGGPADGPRIVLVHGLGGSHLDWALVGSRLAERARVVAVDLAGFGLTPVAGRSTTVPGNLRLLERFVAEVVGGPAVLVGNSMGGMISLLAAADRPDLVAGVVGIDAALPLVARARVEPVVSATFALMSVPMLGERVLLRRNSRTTAKRLVRETLQLCCVDADAVPDDLVEAFVSLRERRLREDGVERAFAMASRSIVSTLMQPRTYVRRISGVKRPVLLLQGDRDRLVPVGAARRAAELNPHWRLVTFRDVGHVPQIEAPEETVAQIFQWLDHDGRAALAAARTEPAPAVRRGA